MERSENINELTKALVSFHKAMKPLELDAEVEVKTKSGAKYSFKYATLSNIVNTCRKLLTDNGLVIAQLVGNEGAVTTILLHESGQYVQDTMLIKSGESSPQAIGSAISYTKRYQYGSILGLVTEQDDDANIAEGNEFEAKKESPWITEKQKNNALERIKAANPNVIIKINEEETHMSIDEFVTKINSEFRIKRIWKEELNYQGKLRNEELKNPKQTKIEV